MAPMRRREFIAGLSGAVAWPLTARAQQPNRVRRIGVLMGARKTIFRQRSGFPAFTQGLAELGWTNGRNPGWTFVGPATMLTERGRSPKNWSTCNPT